MPITTNAKADPIEPLQTRGQKRIRCDEERHDGQAEFQEGCLLRPRSARICDPKESRPASKDLPVIRIEDGRCRSLACRSVEN